MPPLTIASTMAFSWRYILAIAASSLLLLASSPSTAEVVQTTSCDDNEAATPATQRHCDIHELRVNPCPEALEGKGCKIKRGENVSLSFDFTPHTFQENSTLSARAYWANDLVDLPLLGMETNACSFTSCPLKPNEKQTYTYTLPISKLFPVRAYNVKWKLWDEDDLECCFIFPIKLVK